MKPDTAIFHQHVNDGDFQTGVDQGMWGICNENSEYPTWPMVVIWVQAASKPNRLDKYHFRFDLAGYPSAAPTTCPWNIETGNRLDSSLWPKGSRFVSSTFNPGWNQNALYAPCDRVAMVGHHGWKTQFPDLWWQPTFKITVYLNFLHRLLNSSDYAKS
jgi:hypothetical protein